MGRLCEDLWFIVLVLVGEIKDLKFLVVVRFGLMQFFLVVRMIFILDCILDGWLLINVVVGGDLYELVGDGLFISYDECYEVIDEFLIVWWRFLQGEMVFYEGKYIKVENSNLFFLLQ